MYLFISATPSKKSCRIYLVQLPTLVKHAKQSIHNNSLCIHKSFLSMTLLTNSCSLTTASTTPFSHRLDKYSTLLKSIMPTNLRTSSCPSFPLTSNTSLSHPTLSWSRCLSSEMSPVSSPSSFSSSSFKLSGHSTDSPTSLTPSFSPSSSDSAAAVSSSC
eukprot:GHVQ01036236.1.p1 GENE.GHVQ01036236.1~~GHVQ01036236.1.p1  ORF type:complete len:160 (+),score=18.93 GHVQ01036236.1:707-1186(+)